MISTVCQDLQSYVEPHVLSFQLLPHESSSSSKPLNRDEDDSKQFGGWSFVKAHEKAEQVYVHPLVNRSSSKLSIKSLEMCTESLGSESGSDIGENDASNLLTLEPDDSTRSASTWAQKKTSRRRGSSFPPPLTSISGSTGVRVESHREDGRLVLKAVALSASGSGYFHAERSHGRLKLQLVTDMAMSGEEDEGRISDGDEDGGSWEAEEMSMEEVRRPCRCKQGNRESIELLNWEPLWVST